MKKDKNENKVAAELIVLLGHDGFIKLVEEFGGIRLYIPININGSQVTASVGYKIAACLAFNYAREYIKVPLARDLRARHYRTAGLSNAQIARKLGVTENGVERIFRRTPSRYLLAKNDDRQIELFPPK